MSDVPDDDEDLTLDEVVDLIAEMMAAYGIERIQIRSHAHVQAEYERPDRLN